MSNIGYHVTVCEQIHQTHSWSAWRWTQNEDCFITLITYKASLLRSLPADQTDERYTAIVTYVLELSSSTPKAGELSHAHISGSSSDYAASWGLHHINFKNTFVLCSDLLMSCCHTPLPQFQSDFDVCVAKSLLSSSLQFFVDMHFNNFLAVL